MTSKKLIGAASAVIMAVSMAGTTAIGASAATVPTLNYNGHKYQLIDKSKSWEDAKAYCEKMGGHLVTITDKKEQDAVKALLKKGNKKNYWLGGSYKNGGTLGSFKWVTGEKASYTNFFKPSQFGGRYFGNNYALMMFKEQAPYQAGSQFAWNVLNTTGKSGNSFYDLGNFGFVCEFDNNKTASDENAIDITTDVSAGYTSVVTYTGKVVIPSDIVVKYGETELRRGVDYKLSGKNNVKPGTATITVTGKGKYKGSFSFEYIIVPASVNTKSASPVADGSVLVEWDKVPFAGGYRVEVATSDKFDADSIVTYADFKSNRSNGTVKGLSYGRLYFVRVVPFIKMTEGSEESTYFGGASNSKYFKIDRFGFGRNYGWYGWKF